MAPPARPRVHLLLGLLVAVVVPLCGPGFVRSLRPPDGVYLDFLQEWLSARNPAAGLPVYAHQDQSFRVHTGGVPGSDGRLSYNAHPPVAVLLTAPLAGFDYQSAHLLWNLLTVPLVPLCIGWTARELGRPLRPAEGLLLVSLLLSCSPLLMQVLYGQLNPVLLLLVTAGWTLDRRGYTGWAGAMIGAAAAVKLAPIFLFLYFVFTRQWRAVLGGAAAFVGLNLLAAGVYGADTYRDYVTVVLPTLGQYERNWANVSIGAIPLRLFDPHPREPIVGLAHLPAVGIGLAWAARGLIALTAAWAAWRAITPAARDRAFALAVVGTLLVSPITWNHFYLLLPLPLLLALREPIGRWRWPLYAAVVIMWLPNLLPFYLASGAARAEQVLTQPTAAPISRYEHLWLLAVLHPPLLLLFARLARRPDRIDAVPP